MSEQPRFLVVGGGVAALATAVHLCRAGKNVQLLTPHPRVHMGRLARHLRVHGAERAPDKVADATLVEHLRAQGETTLRWLVRLGVPLDRGHEGAVQLQDEPTGQFVTAGADLGLHVHRAWAQQARRWELEGRLQVLERVEVAEIVVKNGRCAGVVHAEPLSGNVAWFPAAAVCVAPDGWEELWGESALGPSGGAQALAAAWAAGAELANPEFVRFNIAPHVEEGVAVEQTLGGLAVSSEPERAHRTTVSGLMAAGGGAAGYHGAGSDEADVLLSHMVSAELAAEAMLADGTAPPAVGDPSAAWRDQMARAVAQRGDENAYLVADEVRTLMRRCVGPMRQAAWLDRALDGLKALRKRCQAIDTRGGHPLAWMTLSLPLQMDLCEAVVHAAQQRQESRGSHVREDYPQPNDVRFGSPTRVQREGAVTKAFQTLPGTPRKGRP